MVSLNKDKQNDLTESEPKWQECEIHEIIGPLHRPKTNTHGGQRGLANPHLNW